MRGGRHRLPGVLVPGLLGRGLVLGEAVSETSVFLGEPGDLVQICAGREKSEQCKKMKMVDKRNEKTYKKGWVSAWKCAQQPGLATVFSNICMNRGPSNTENRFTERICVLR